MTSSGRYDPNTTAIRRRDIVLVWHSGINAPFISGHYTLNVCTSKRGSRAKRREATPGLCSTPERGLRTDHPDTGGRVVGEFVTVLA